MQSMRLPLNNRKICLENSFTKICWICSRKSPDSLTKTRTCVDLPSQKKMVPLSQSSIPHKRPPACVSHSNQLKETQAFKTHPTVFFPYSSNEPAVSEHICWPLNSHSSPSQSATCCQKRSVEASLTSQPLKLAIAPNRMALGVVYCNKSINRYIWSLEPKKFILSSKRMIPIPMEVPKALQH